eukprot:5851006-Pleurochrysis_carterae.AAC.1
MAGKEIGVNLPPKCSERQARPSRHRHPCPLSSFCTAQKVRQCVLSASSSEQKDPFFLGWLLHETVRALQPLSKCECVEGAVLSQRWAADA